MSSESTAPLNLTIHVTLDRTALSELAAALVPFVAHQIQGDLVAALSQAAATRPNGVELRYPEPINLVGGRAPVTPPAPS